MTFTYESDHFESRRSPVLAPNGAVATSSPLAARAGLRALEDGGTVADAAVTTAAVLDVVEPHMTGVGGDAFVLAHVDGETVGLNGSGPAPAAADRETVLERAREQGGPSRDIPSAAGPKTEDEPAQIPTEGGLPVTVPGALGAWQALLDRFGSRTLADALAPAIRYAREGFPVGPVVAREWAVVGDRLRGDACDWYHGDDPPEAGDVVRLPALADTLELLAERGPEALYGGELGQAVAETVQDHGGLLTVADLADYAPEWTEPVRARYGDLEVLEHPPNGQGAVALAALSVADALDLPADPRDPERLHRLIEAVKLGFADGYAHVADPAHEAVPVSALADPDYGAERASLVGESAGTYAPAARAWGEDTVYLCVADGDGNAVSFINSLYMGFGSAIAARGVPLQNRGHAFSLDPDHPNCIAPGKRPYHTIIPGLLFEDGDLRGPFGVMGGSMQPQGHLQVVANLASGLEPQAALDAPRFRWLEGTRVAVETDRLPAGAADALRERGHDIIEGPRFRAEDGHWGGGQVIWRQDDGTLVAGSEPRKDGQAVGF